MKKIFLMLCLLSLRGFSMELHASNPSYLKIKIYKVAFSTSPLCTNLTTVYSKAESDATYVDVLGTPTLAEKASLDDGTYKCVAIEFSSVIKFSPSVADGSCTANTEYSLDVCANSTNFQLIDGTTGTCSNTRGVEEHLGMYISTASTQTNGTNGHTAFMPPLNESGDDTRGFNLASAFVKSGAVTKKFVVNGTGKISGSGSSCEMQPPLFSFQ